MIIMLFSINVAFVMGNFKAVPKHAQRIALLSIRALVTPTVVIPSIIIVAIREIFNATLKRNAKPKTVSIAG